MNNELLQNIGSKKQKLEELRKHLKNKFFGIDNEIDKIIDSMTTWYAMPDIITHPIIINLWSLTGNGKTDLVRTIVDFLQFNDHFCEIQLSDTCSTADGKPADKISTLILKSGCKENKQGIILLDEFQRYRTVNDMGDDVKGLPYQDIWMLLSDGHFPVEDKKQKDYQKLVKKLGFEWKTVELDAAGNITKETAVEDEDEFFMMRGMRMKSKKQKSKIDYLYLPRTNDKYFGNWDDDFINDIFVFLDFSVSEKDIASWTYLETLANVKKYNESRTSTYDFTKCLIFVAGNLDEAFQVAGDVDNCDTDADIFHEYTKKVSIIEIKKALTTRFKPEQISRLGNNHIIYPSLNKSSYLCIIEKCCNAYLKKAEEICNKQFILDESVIHEIYDNAVYPTQGTRPVFSSIHMMFSAPLSSGMLWAIENNISTIRIKIYTDASCLTFMDDSNMEHNICVPIQFQIRDRKNRHSDNFSAMVSVHEMGHAILHSDLFKTSPKEIKINVASFDGGYNKYQFKYSCANDILDRVCVSFGGIVAEELLFGAEHRSTGAESDIVTATSLAASYVRKWSMDTEIGCIDINALSANTTIRNVAGTDSNVSRILKEQKKRAYNIIIKYKQFLIKSSKDLIQRKAFTQQEYKDYCGNIFDFSNDNRDKDKIDTNTNYYELLMNQ